MPTIVLADDHHIVRQGFRALLDSVPSFTVVGEAANGLAAVDLVEKLHPQILIVDLMLPGLNGLEVINQTRHRAPKTHVIVLSMHADEAYVIQALGNGASGYVLKDSKVGDLVQAINTVLADGYYLSPPLSERALDSYVQAAESVTTDPYQNLTSREREVFNLVAEGNTSGEIAEKLSISSRTVEVHRANMMRKLNLHTPTELIRYALKKGILPPDAQA